MKTTRTRIKICGITNAADALGAVDAGADAIGVVLTESPRQVSIEEAADALRQVPPFVTRVGVFVDADPEFVAEAVRELHLGAVQYHGEETPQQCAAAPAPCIKALTVREGVDLADRFAAYRSVAAAFLLDTFVPGMTGGTGQTFAWDSVPKWPSWANVIVAGGLNPVNVGAAIAALVPYAVDVSSGVEERRRHKDPMKLQAFVTAVRTADEEVRR